MDDNNSETPVRNEKGHFKKGVSGNPAGGNKPRIFRASNGLKLDIEELYRNEAGRIFYELVKTILDPDTPATAKISGIKEFNDRAMGKALQSMRTVRSDDTQETIDVTQLSNEALSEIALARRLTDGTK